MTKKFSSRAQNLSASPTVLFFEKVQQQRAQGKKIYNFTAGEPDFKPHPNIIQTISKALSAGKTGYSTVQGEKNLRQALAQKYSTSQNNLSEENILISHGSKESLFILFQCLLDFEDEVLFPAPYWVTFPESIKIAGGVPRIISSKPDFSLDYEAFLPHINDKTKAILLNYPNNPSGKSLDLCDLEKIIALAEKYNLYLIYDEAYHQYDFTLSKPHNLWEYSSQNRHFISVGSFSKTYGMTGLRLGYTVANKKLIEIMTRFQGQLSGNVPSCIQEGGLTALNLETSEIKYMKNIFHQRSLLFYEKTKDFLNITPSEGAFYYFINMKKYLHHGLNSCHDLAHYLLEEAGVASVPGAAFGVKGFLRFSFACSDEEIIAGTQKMREALCKLD